MRTVTVTVTAEHLPAHRRGILRAGGRIRVSSPVAGGYAVTAAYPAPALELVTIGGAA